MTDTKISDFVSATVLNAVDIVPVIQTALNKKITLGQLRTFVNTPSIQTVTGAAIPLSADIIAVSGICTLAAGTEGQTIKFIATATGKISAIGLLPSNGFTFSTGNTLELLYALSKWNVMSQNGMTVGIV